MQALVNTSRPALAEALALSLPASFSAERELWTSVSGLVHHGAHDDYLKVLDPRRVPSEVVAASGVQRGAGVADGGAAGSGGDSTGATD